MAKSNSAKDTWRGYRQQGFPEGSWTFADGVLHAHGDATRVDLVSRESYRNFRLSLEWCLPPGGNSVILYRVSEEVDDPSETGPEMRLLDDALHPDAADPKTSCGALDGLLAPGQAATARRTVPLSRARRPRRAGRALARRCSVLRYELGDDHLKAQITASNQGRAPFRPRAARADRSAASRH
jgi:hypothetical protein